MINEEDIKHYFSDNLWKAMSKNEKKRFTDLKIIINTKDIEVKEEPTQVEESIDDVRVHADILKNEMQVTSEFDETDDSKLLEIGECKVSCNEVLRTCEGDDGVESEERSTEELQFVKCEKSTLAIESNLDGQRNVCEEYQSKQDLSNERDTERHLPRFSCAHCDYKTNKRKYLTSHFRNKHSTDDKEFKCSRCQYETSNKHIFKCHLTTHFLGNDKKLKCPHCDYRTNRELCLKRHVGNRHTDAKEHKCPQCKYETNDKRYMKEHSKTHENVKPYQCEVCTKRFKLRSNLRMHNRTHSEEKRFQCAKCDFKTKWKPSLVSHLRERHVHVKEKDREALERERLNKPYECHVCSQRNSENVRGEPAKDDGKKYSCSQCAYKSDLKCSYEFHLYEHSACSKFVYLGQEFLRCNLCKFAYKTESSMQNHIMVKHKKHGCSMCAYKTNCSWEMAQHTAVHSGEVSLISVRLCECSKRFVCVHCGYKANNKTRLTAHMESKHINEKNFKCFYCDFTSNYRRSLSVHLTTHYSVNNRKLFKCSKCNYQTNGPARLKNHRNNKHGSVKKYRCSSCDYGTNIISHMNKHLATHEQTRPYECDVCKRRFKRNYLLKGHSLMHMGEKKKFDNKRTTKKRD